MRLFHFKNSDHGALKSWSGRIQLPPPEMTSEGLKDVAMMLYVFRMDRGASYSQVETAIHANN